jgi:catechol 2,3-dioxygenase-like lactoylglutathione lyase family enzyme
MEVTKVAGLTLQVRSMSRALHFYKDILGLKLLYGDENSSFCSFDVNGTYLNLELSERVETQWGRVIFYCDDVDEVHGHLGSGGFLGTRPRDAPWGERFFHVKDPDGHEISVAMRLEGKGR